MCLPVPYSVSEVSSRLRFRSMVHPNIQYPSREGMEKGPGEPAMRTWDSASEQSPLEGGSRRQGPLGKASSADGKQRPPKGCNKDSTAMEATGQCHIPLVPNGPLVISAGWGRTGTSSLKVRTPSYRTTRFLDSMVCPARSSSVRRMSCMMRACTLTLQRTFHLWACAVLGVRIMPARLCSDRPYCTTAFVHVVS